MFEAVLLFVGASLVNAGLEYGAGVHFGWWGAAFWFGFGLIYAALKLDR